MTEEIFTNVPYSSPATPPTAAEEVRAYASQFFNTLEDLAVGVGATAFKVDQSGMWLGGNLFSEAPFRVDMLGNVVANSILINGLGGDIIAGAIDGDGNFINELISTSINTQSKQILGEFEFAGFGAIAMATDANNGVWISPTGILGKKAGATTFAIDTGGNATFGGTLVAASGTFGTVTAGTFTGVSINGSTIKANNGTGADIWLENTGNLSFRYGGGEKASMFSDTSGNLLLNADNNLFLTYNDGGGTDGFAVYNDGVLSLRLDDANDLYIKGTIYNDGDIFCGGTFRSSDGSSGSTTSEDIVTSVYLSGNNLKYEYQAFTWKDGLLTNKGSAQTATVGQVIGNG